MRIPDRSDFVAAADLAVSQIGLGLKLDNNDQVSLMVDNSSVRSAGVLYAVSEVDPRLVTVATGGTVWAVSGASIAAGEQVTVNNAAKFIPVAAAGEAVFGYALDSTTDADQKFRLNIQMSFDTHAA